jgi:hypothetical protein
MSRFRFELASEADDADLRHVLAETPMQGRIAVAFRREPSWFAAAAVDGQRRQVVACRDVESGRIVGFGCRSIRTLYVDGRPQSVGYLSSLRLLEAYRKMGLIARGYAYFRRLHEDCRTPYYLTTIAEGNLNALNVLTSGRAGLPHYIPAGAYHTLAIPLVKRNGAIAIPGVAVRRASFADVPAIVGFLAAHGPKRQFFPVVRESDLTAKSGAWPGLRIEDLWLAWRGDELAGVLGAWDQHAYKQSVVTGYHGSLAWLRPALNAWWSLRGGPRLPAPGEPLRFRVAALAVVQNDSEEVFQSLLSRAAAHSEDGECSHLLVGLHERDPLLAAARRRSASCFTTHLFLVSWKDGDEVRATSRRRVPYLELGTL